MSFYKIDKFIQM